MFTVSDKTKDAILSLNHKIEDFDDEQLECVEFLVNNNLNGNKFINPKIDGFVMNKVLFSISETPENKQILEFIEPNLNYGTLEKILRLKEEGREESANELINIWKLHIDEIKKIQLQNLIMRNIPCKDMYGENNFDEKYQALVSKHLGLDDRIENLA